MAFTTADNNFAVSKWIVNKTAGLGTHTTVQSAINAAASGDVVFIMPGTYTEDLTLAAGVALTAFSGDGIAGSVIIKGNATLTANGTTSITGIQLQTNSNFLLTISGTNTCQVDLTNCYLNCTNNTGISVTNSVSAGITMNYCNGDIGTTGITLISSAVATLTITINNTTITNSGASTTASTLATSNTNFYSCIFYFPISSSLNLNFYSCYLLNGATNATCVSITGGTTNLNNCMLTSGTAACISVTSPAIMNVNNTIIDSTNANPITGSGTLNIAGITYSNTGIGNNVTTVALKAVDGGYYRGIQGSTTPPAGDIGEQIRSFINSAGAVSISNSSYAQVTNITLTPGIWDVSGIVMFTGLTTTTEQGMNICVTNAGAIGAVNGDSAITTTFASTTAGDVGMSIPQFRIALAASTIYYMNAFAAYSAGTGKAYGRLSAVRAA